MAAQRVIMVDRVHWLGSSYIKRGAITLEEKENLIEMYNAYKGLGGNGHLKIVMDEVDQLEISKDV